MKLHHVTSSRKLSLAVAVALAAAGWGVGGTAHGADGTWNSDSPGNWDDTTQWLNGVVADGVDSTARFDVDLTAARTVTVTPSPGTPGTRTIGNLFSRDANDATPFDWILAPDGGGTTLTLDVTSGLAQVNVPARNIRVDAIIVGDDGLRKFGVGNLFLTAANTLSGPVHVTAGQIRLQGAGGSLLNADTIVLDRGTLEMLNNVPGGAGNPNRLSDTTPIRINTGTLTLQGGNQNVGQLGETVGPVTATGSTQIRVEPINNVTNARNTFLTLGGLVRPTGTENVRFNKQGAGAFGDLARIIITAQGDSQFMGGWATVTSTPAGATDYSSDFARYDTADAPAGPAGVPMGVRPLDPAGRPLDLEDPAITDTSDVRITSTTPPAMTASRTIRSLVIASPSTGGPGSTTTFIQDLGGNTLDLTSGGLLRGSRNLTAANAATDVFVITNGTLTAGAAPAGGNLFLIVEETGSTLNQLHVDARITNSPGGGPVTLVKGGPGQLTLRGNNDYAGGTVLNAGILEAHYGSGASPLGGGPITLIGGSLQPRSDASVTTLGNNVTTDGFNPQIEAGRSSPATAGPVAFNFGTLTVNNTSGLAFIRFDIDTVAATFDPASPTDAASVGFGATTINANTTFDINRPGERTTVVTLGGVTDGAGTFGLTKVDAGELVINAPSDYGGGTFVNGGTLRVTGAGTLGTGPATVNGGVLRVETAAGAGPVTVNGGTFDAAATQTVGALTVNDGGRAVVTRAAGATSPTVLTTGAFTVGTITAQVDVTNNALIVDYAAGASDLAEVRSAIFSGYAAGAWTGPGIVSSTAAANSAGAVGYAESADILGPAGGTFLGQPADADAVLVRYTLAGDATLDGNVNFDDLAKLAQNYNNTDGNRLWVEGDFTYDGNVNFDDLAKLAQNYNTGLPTAAEFGTLGASAAFREDVARAFAQVPEPGVLSVLVVGGAALMRRRRRDR